MGKRFVEPMPFAIEPSFHDSTATSPLIFVLSPGSDPMAALLTFAEEKGIRVESVSLGQGQGPVAQRWIDEGAKEGFWVVLQNCHLAKSFLPALELICEQQLVEGKVGGVQWGSSSPMALDSQANALSPLDSQANTLSSLDSQANALSPLDSQANALSPLAYTGCCKCFNV